MLIKRIALKLNFVNNLTFSLNLNLNLKH